MGALSAALVALSTTCADYFLFAALILRHTMPNSSKKAKVTDEHRAEAARLRAIWDRVQPTSQAAFAKEFGIGGQTAVSNFLNGVSALSLKAARGFAEGLNCDVADFSPRLAKEIASLVDAAWSQDTMDDFVQVRRTDVRFSNGVGRLVFTEDDGEPLMFRADFLRRMGIRPPDAVVVRADGISNEPKIASDAVVLVNRGDRDRLDGGFFAFRVDGELLIKRLERIDGVGILAVAENPNFTPKTRLYSGEIDFEVIGRAVWVGAVL